MKNKIVEIKVRDIKIGPRHRKDMGDLQTLAQAIQKVGLLHPIGVTPQLELVFGERRLRACQLLGWENIPARVIDIPAIALGEYHENCDRKDFTPSELVAVVESLRAYKHGGDRKSDQFRNSDDDRLTTEEALGQVGLKKDMYCRAKRVVDQGIPELVEAMDSGKLSVFAASELAQAEPQEQRIALKTMPNECKLTALAVRKQLRRLSGHHGDTGRQSPRGDNTETPSSLCEWISSRLDEAGVRPDWDAKAVFIQRNGQVAKELDLQNTEKVYTSVWGDNAVLMEQIASLYFLPGYRIADVTYGKGVFWRNIDTTKYNFHPSDLATCPKAPFDFRRLPYPDASCDVVVFDPPYMHGSGTPGIEACYRNAETTKGAGHAEIMRLYERGMAEGTRVLKRNGLLLVKCQDEIESGRQQRSHIEIYEMARRLGMKDQDLFVLTRKQPPTIQDPNQQHARKNHSYMWVFRTNEQVGKTIDGFQREQPPACCDMARHRLAAREAGLPKAG
jgi:hypothetical protein